MYAALENVTKSFGAELILENVCGTVNEGDRIGLIGVNGAGKTTLLRVLLRELAPDEGGVSHRSGLSVGYLKQNSGLTGGNTVMGEMKTVFSAAIAAQKEMERLTEALAERPEDLALARAYDAAMSAFLAQDGYHIEVNIKKILNGMGFSDKDTETVVDTMSGGEKTRLALCKLLLKNPELLVLDEPTNHLDMDTLRWLEGYLGEYRGAILVVSHDRYFLDKVTRKTWELEDCCLNEYRGNYSAYKMQKAERTAFLLKEYEKQQNQIESMTDYARRNMARASTSNMAKSRLKQIEHIAPIKKPRERTPAPSFCFPAGRRAVADVLSVRELTLKVGREQKTIVSDISFEVKRGERLAVIGANGTGKSTLLKSLMGMLPQQGEVVWGNNTEIGYYDQENKDMNPNQAVLDELWKRFPALPEHSARGYLGRVLLIGDDVYKKVGSLSGGERAKLGFAILMAGEKNVLVLDEPTNHLDLSAREELERALRAYEGTLIFVSHDRYFVNALAERVLAVGGQRARLLEGNYDSYMAQLEREQAAGEGGRTADGQTSAPAEDGRSKNQKRQRQQQAKLRQEISGVEKRIAALEAELAELSRLIAEHPADFELLAESCARLEQVKVAHEQALEEWMQLAE